MDKTTKETNKNCIKITDAEDVEFLENLKNQLNTQPNYQTANPRVFVIRNIKEIVTQEGYEDVMKLINYETGEEYVFSEIYSLLEDIMETKEIIIEESTKDQITFSCEFDTYSVYGKGYDIHMDSNTLRFLQENLNESIDFVPLKFIEEDINVFLTKEAAEQYFNRYRYNFHPKARIYLKYLEKNPEMTQLIQILSKLEK